jgi:hypothetical protein
MQSKTQRPSPETVVARGDWFITHSGKFFFPMDPHPEDVDINDIAHALSFICRFGGHCRQFYSVAQHSVLVSEYAEVCSTAPLIWLQALIHDATEAYIGDMVRPLKLAMGSYRDVETKLEAIVHEALGIPLPNAQEKPFIKEADNALLMTERRDLMNHRGVEWSTPAKAWTSRTIEPVSPQSAANQFLRRYHRLALS